MPAARSSQAARKRAPRGTLNPEVIVNAAITLIDAEGLTALTTRRLAADLDVRPMALYVHFRDKDAILRAVADELLSRFQMPALAQSPLESVRRIMSAYFQILIDNPVLLRIDTAVDEITPADARIFEAVYQCLKELDLDHQTSVGFAATLVRFVVGCAFLYPVRRVWEDDPALWDRYRSRLAALPPETFPVMHSLADDLPTYTQQQAFEFGLQAQLVAVATAAGVALPTTAPSPSGG